MLEEMDQANLTQTYSILKNFRTSEDIDNRLSIIQCLRRLMRMLESATKNASSTMASSYSDMLSGDSGMFISSSC